MIHLKQTKETFRTLHEAKAAVLRVAREAESNARTQLTLAFDPRTYILERPFVCSVKDDPELQRVELSLVCEDGIAEFTSAVPLYPKAKDIYERSGCDPSLLQNKTTRS